MTTKKMIEVMQAYVDGEQIEYKSIKNGPVEKLAAYDFLFDNCIWQDGTPCGVKK